MFNIVKLIKAIIYSILDKTPRNRSLLEAQATKAERHKKETASILSYLKGFGHLQILGGPFKGLRYVDRAQGSQLLPKLLGTYEQPIVKWIDDIIREPHYDLIVDVGCAEGYYAVGFAHVRPDLKIVAIDINPVALKDAETLITLNSLQHRVKLESDFTPELLTNLTTISRVKHGLIFMDVEGAELLLLNPDTFANLTSFDIIVELHDCFNRGITEKIIEYLSNSHELELIIDTPKRSKPENLDGDILKKLNWKTATDEQRPPNMRWLRARKFT